MASESLLPPWPRLLSIETHLKTWTLWDIFRAILLPGSSIIHINLNLTSYWLQVRSLRYPIEFIKRQHRDGAMVLNTWAKKSIHGIDSLHPVNSPLLQSSWFEAFTAVVQVADEEFQYCKTKYADHLKHPRSRSTVFHSRSRPWGWLILVRKRWPCHYWETRTRNPAKLFRVAFEFWIKMRDSQLPVNYFMNHCC